jgi:hypothetical protein
MAPGHIEASGDGVAALVDQPERGDDRDGRDRQVDEEHPPPRQRGRQHAAGKEPDSPAGAGDSRPHAERPVALLAFGEDHRQQAEGGRGHERRAEPMDSSRAHEQRGDLARPQERLAAAKTTMPETNTSRRP